MGEAPSQEGRRCRRHGPSGTLDPVVSAKRARSASTARTGVGKQHHSSESLMSFLKSAFLVAFFSAGQLTAQRLLVPMDDQQQNHLKAYGLTYTAIKSGASA